MDQADSVHSTPPTNTSAPLDSARELETGLAIQQREREATLRDLARLRKEASAEIDRLLAFLDASDEYAAEEREPDGDELDASFPESGSRMCTPGEDDEEDDFGEDGSDDEPSLGSGATGEWSTQGRWALPGTDDMEDEHDGAEPSEDDEPSIGYDCSRIIPEQDTGEMEPSLGWTVDGCMTGGTRQGRHEVAVDLEAGEMARQPQDRTDLGRGVHTEPGWCGRSRLVGLTEAQQEAFKARMPRDGEISVY